MIRTTACLMMMAALSAICGAQSPSANGLTSAQRHQLFARNRDMIQTLVDSSVDISNKSGDYFQRSQLYHKVVMKLQDELNNAALVRDGGRVAELGKHLDTVLRDGFVPSLKKADEQIGPNGTDRPKIVQMRDTSMELVDWLQRQAKNKWADTPEVRKVIETLDQTKKHLENSIP